MPFDYSYVLPPTGEANNAEVREMFEDVKAYVNTLISGGGSGAPASSTYIVMSVDAALANERVLTGTSNQVIITDNGAGSTVVLSLPQSINTTADVQFDSLHLGAGNSTDSALFFDNIAEANKYGFYVNDDTFPATTFESLRLRRATQTIVDFYYNATHGKGLYVHGLTDSSPFGTVSTPSLTIRSDAGAKIIFQADPTSDPYTLTLPLDDGDSGDVLSTDGSGVLSWMPEPATRALDNLASTAVNVSINPDTPDTLSLGNSTYRWLNGDFSGAINLWMDAPYTWHSVLTAASSLAANTLFVLPPDNGSNFQVLTTDGSGVTYWGPGTGAGAATTALDNLSAVAINTGLVSDTDNTDDLGTSAKTWRRLYVKTGLVVQESGAGTDAVTIQAPSALSGSYSLTLPVDDGTGDQVLATNGSGVLSWVTSVVGNANLTLSNVASTAVGASLIPGTDNSIDLGSPTHGWKDFHLTGSLHVYDGTNANYVQIYAASGTDAYSLQLPPNNGANNQYLTTDGNGILTWTNAAGTGTVNSGTANRLAYYASSTNAVSELTAITTSRALASDANGLPVAATTTATELGYVNGVTSAIQTQINLKAPIASPTFTGVVTTPTIEITNGTVNPTSLTNVTLMGSVIGFDTNFNALKIGPRIVIGSVSLTSSVPSTEAIYYNNILFNGSTYEFIETGAGLAYVQTAGGLHRFYSNTGIGGATFSPTLVAEIGAGDLTLPKTTNQLILGTTRTVTITAPTPASSSRTWTLPDLSTSPTFAALEGSQTFTGQKTLSAAAGNPIHGTNTNDSASAGYVGEYIESLVGVTSHGGSATFVDAASISLTAGDWDVTGIVQIVKNTGTFTSTYFGIGISTTSGNSSAGLTDGQNAGSDAAVVPVTFTRHIMDTPVVRVSISSTTTYYLKLYMDTYTSGTPQFACRLSARRVR